MYSIVIPREPDYDAYTYEEVNDRRLVQVNPHLSPDPPRQSEAAPRKPAEMQAAFFYDHAPDNLDGGDETYNLEPSNLGAHVVVARDQSWTSSPRGIMQDFGVEQPMDRELPASFGSLIEPLAGGKF